MPVKYKDKGWGAIKKSLSRGKQVAVGVLGPKAEEIHEDSKATVAEIATWNHFGTSIIPARPFIAQPVEQHREEILSFQARLYAGVLAKKLSETQALELLGEKIRNLIVKDINEGGLYEPNAASTIEAKGSSKPLIGITAQLKGSISFEVREV